MRALTWQGTGADNSKFPGATSIWEGIRDNVQKAGGAAEMSADGTYKVKPDHVGTNKQLVQAVYDELHETQPGDTRYVTSSSRTASASFT